MNSSTSWLTEEQLRAWKGLSLMQLQLQARLSRRLGDHGLSFQDYLVLASLFDRPDAQSRVVELSEELGWEKSRLSHHITRMCERGLVAKVACPSDQRGIFVKLTNLGRRTLREAAPDHVSDVQNYFFERLNDEQVTTLATIAERVLAHLSDDAT